MPYLTTFVQKFFNMLAIANVQYLLAVIAVAIVIRYLVHRFPAFSRLLALACLLFLLFYLGILPLAELALTLAAGLVLGRRFLPRQSRTLQLITGSFLIFAAFVVLVHLTNQLWLPRYLLLATGLFILLLSRPKNLSYFLSSINALNVIDLTLLITVFCLSTVPQLHWDAAYANLYIAKWYVALNSFSPLPEAISSLFPQAGNIYYAWFAARGARFLGLGIFLPLLALLALVKSLVRRYSFSLLAQIILYAALTLPIVIFQGSNGYYDLLTLDVVLTAVILLTVKPAPYLLSLLLLGFAGTLKLFPLALVPLPIVLYLRDNKLSFRSLTKLLITILLALIPITLYSLRSYRLTGSPVFPFFQSLFPTPEFWSPNFHLEQISTLQSPLSPGGWLKGGFARYPFLTFFDSSSYMEATPHYVGLIYLLVMPIQLIILLVSLKQIFSRSPRHTLAHINLGAFLGYLGVGTVIRYYRYLWPYQFTWLITSLILLTQPPFAAFVKKVSRPKYLPYVLSLIFVGNFYWLISYYRFYPLDISRLFRPDYFLTTQNDSEPTLFLNARLNPGDVILDSSTYFLPRLNFKSRVFQCNWYYIQGQNKIGREDPVTNFRYLITDIPPNPNNYCTKYLIPLIESDIYRQVFQDNYYAIYEKTE